MLLYDDNVSQYNISQLLNRIKEDGQIDFSKYKDILNVLLNDNKLYTRAEVEQIIKNAYSGKYQID